MIPSQLLPIISTLASSSLAQYIKRKQDPDDFQDRVTARPEMILKNSNASTSIQLSEDLNTCLRQTTLHTSRSPHPVYEDFEPPQEGMWQDPDSEIDIAGFHIKGGMFYVGDVLKGAQDKPEPSLINPAMPAQCTDATDLTIDIKLPEWPQYHQMTPNQRAQYLQWLASERDNPNIEEGYLWLYISGIERYLLIDGPRARFSTAARMYLENELLRLQKVYQAKTRIANAIASILNMSWAASHDPHYVDALPQYMDFSHADAGDLFPWRLGTFVTQRKPIPPRVLLEWFMHHPRYPQRNLTPDTFNVFLSLFTERFEREFGDGFIVPTNKVPLCVAYRATNQCLGTLMFDFTGVCNVFEDCISLERIKTIVQTCALELNDYAEYIKQSNPNPIGLLARMPEKILKVYPPFLTFQNTLAMAAQTGVAMISVQTLFETLGMPNVYAVTDENANDMAKLLQIAGYACAPDIRYHNTSMPVHGQIVIAQRTEIPQKTEPFSIMAVILQLGAIVAQIDEHISPTEVSILQNMILERKILDDAQRTSLLLWLHWCLNTPQNITAITQKLDVYPKALQTHISQILISVACADGIIDRTEYIALRKLYRALQIPEDWVQNHLEERGFHLDPNAISALNALEKQEKRTPTIHQAKSTKTKEQKAKEDEEFERMFYTETNYDDPLTEELPPSSDTNYAPRAAQYDYNPISCVEIDANLNAALSMLSEIK